MAGATYYLLMRQPIENDKKIRALALLKVFGLAIDDIDQEISNNSNASITNDSTVLSTKLLAEAIALSEEPTDDNVAVIHYVCGCLCRFTVRLMKCDSCKDALFHHRSTRNVFE